MKVDFWEDDRPKAPYLRLDDARMYITEINTYRFGLPQIDAELCTDCNLCWIFCPEGAIARTTDGLIVDYHDCRGCGLCAFECLRHAIKLVEDADV